MIRLALQIPSSTTETRILVGKFLCHHIAPSVSRIRIQVDNVLTSIGTSVVSRRGVSIVLAAAGAGRIHGLKYSVVGIVLPIWIVGAVPILLCAQLFKLTARCKSIMFYNANVSVKFMGQPTFVHPSEYYHMRNCNK